MLTGVLLAAGVLLVLYWAILTGVTGMVPFGNVLGAAGLVLVFLGGLHYRFGDLPGVLCAKKILLPLAAAGVICFCLLEAIVIAGAARKDREAADYMLILGAGLRGKELSVTLESRMDTALQLHQGEIIVVSGGRGHHELIPEAEAMESYLTAHNVPEILILEENRSTNTLENLLYSRDIIEKHSGKSIAEVRVKIISSDFHGGRARFLAARAGYGKVSFAGAPTPPLTVPVNYIREAGAVLKSFLLDKVPPKS